MGQDVCRCVRADPEGPAEGRGSGLGTAGRTISEPGLPGPEGGVSAEWIPVPGSIVPHRTVLPGLQGTRTFHCQNQRGGVEETDGKNQSSVGPVRTITVCHSSDDRVRSIIKTQTS